MMRAAASHMQSHPVNKSDGTIRGPTDHDAAHSDCGREVRNSLSFVALAKKETQLPLSQAYPLTHTTRHSKVAAHAAALQIRLLP